MYMHLFGMDHVTIPDLPCICATLRRATRALTQHYEQALRPARLRATQFTVLQALSLAGELTQGDLGRFLAIDSTTLTRTLAIMNRHGWVVRRRGSDKRERRFRLGERGATALKRALPLWNQAQSKTRRKIGHRRSSELMNFANQVANAFFTGGLP